MNLSKSYTCVLTMASNDSIDKKVLLQVDDYLAPSPSGLDADMPSMTPNPPSSSLPSVRSNEHKGIPAGTNEPARDRMSPPPLKEC